MEKFELLKHKSESEIFHNYTESLLKLQIPQKDLIHQFPIFNGYVNIARYLCLYELYKKTTGVLGHIADIGTWKGASLLFFAKLIKIFEPYSYTQVHGFDWYEGMKPSAGFDDMTYDGQYKGDYELLLKLIKIQNLDNIAFVHKIDITKELDDFFENYKSLQFKIVFLDCGVYGVLVESLKHFWPRLTKGGIIIFDHANHSAVPQENTAIREFFGDTAKINTLEFCRRPSGYIIK